MPKRELVFIPDSNKAEVDISHVKRQLVDTRNIEDVARTKPTYDIKGLIDKQPRVQPKVVAVIERNHPHPAEIIAGIIGALLALTIYGVPLIFMIWLIIKVAQLFVYYFPASH